MRSRDVKMGWVDLETTGLDANLDVPLELGIALTDEWGEIYAAEEWLIFEQSADYVRGLERGRTNKFVQPMHEKSGLWQDLEDESCLTRAEVDAAVCHWLADHGIKFGTLPMCGNSIGSLDRPFVIRHLPKFNEALNYRNVDISSFKEVCKMVNPDLYKNLEPIIGTKADATHRVMGDIEASIKEYRAYLDNFIIVGD